MAIKNETLLQRLKREANSAKVSEWSTASRSWFISSVKGISDPFKTLQSDAAKTRNIRTSFMPGYMYLFRYDPKTKATLPYYDVHPLVIVMGVDPQGMLGMNLHYLPPVYRTALISRLLEFTRYRGANNTNAYLKISYDLLNSSAKHRFFRPAIKRYLYSHVVSSIAKIPFEQWESAVFLPLASFKKSDESIVWRDSRKSLI